MVNFIEKAFNKAFRPSHNRRDEANKENQQQDQHGNSSNKQPKSNVKNLRVNFRSNENRRHSYGLTGGEMVVDNIDDGASEVTLTSSEAERQHLIGHHAALPLNPWHVVTAPKRNRGPLSCPGGSSGGGGTQQGEQQHDRSLEAHSEFQLPRHRRSERRVAGTVIGGGGGGSPIRFNDIGNGRERIRLSNRERDWESGYGNLQWNGRQRAFGGGAATERMLSRYQEKLDEMKQRYTDERTRRKQLQWEKAKLQQDYDQISQTNRQLAIENYHYKSALLFHHQQQQQIAAATTGGGGGNVNAAQTALTQLELNSLFGNMATAAAFNGFPMYGLPLTAGAGMPSWGVDTPSSSSAVPVAGSSTNKQSVDNTPRPLWYNTVAAPWTPRHQQQQQNMFFAQQEMIGNPSAGGGGGPGECLAQSLHSNSSLMQQNSMQYLLPFQPQHQVQQHQSCRPGSQDEVKNYRTGLHQQPNTDSFSESSRATTNQLNEMDQQLERDKHDLISDNSNEGGIFESPEGPRSVALMNNNRTGQQQKGQMNTTFLGGNYSFSANDCQTLLLRDDGYATSETNMSTPGMAPLGKSYFECIGSNGIHGADGANAVDGTTLHQLAMVNGQQADKIKNKRRRRSLSAGHINLMM